MLIVILWSFIHPLLIQLPWTQSQLSEQTNSHPHPNPIYNHQPNLRSKSLDFGMKPLEEQEEHELKQKGQPQSFNLKPFFFLGGDSANCCTTTPSLDWLVKGWKWSTWRRPVQGTTTGTTRSPSYSAAYQTFCTHQAYKVNYLSASVVVWHHHCPLESDDFH